MYCFLFTILLAFLAISFYGAHTAFKHLPNAVFEQPQKDEHWFKVVVTAPIYVVSILYLGFQISLLMIKYGKKNAINSIKNAK